MSDAQDEALLAEASNGDEAAVTAALDAGADINCHGNEARRRARFGAGATRTA